MQFVQQLFSCFTPRNQNNVDRFIDVASNSRGPVLPASQPQIHQHPVNITNSEQVSSVSCSAKPNAAAIPKEGSYIEILFNISKEIDSCRERNSGNYDSQQMLVHLIELLPHPLKNVVMCETIGWMRSKRESSSRAALRSFFRTCLQEASRNSNKEQKLKEEIVVAQHKPDNCETLDFGKELQVIKEILEGLPPGTLGDEVERAKTRVFVELIKDLKESAALERKNAASIARQQYNPALGSNIVEAVDACMQLVKTLVQASEDTVAPEKAEEAGDVAVARALLQLTPPDFSRLMLRHLLLSRIFPPDPSRRTPVINSLFL